MFNTVIKSISCIDDKNYPPLKTVLNNNDTEKLIDLLKRLIACICRFNETCYFELLFSPGNLIAYTLAFHLKIKILFKKKRKLLH